MIGNFRIKTREEFVKEFGNDWRNVNMGFIQAMDSILGVPLYNLNIISFKSYLDKFLNNLTDPNNKDFFEIEINGLSYSISSDMIIKDRAKINLINKKDR